jgi:hypothetical protein
MIDRGHAASLLVRNVGEGLDFLNLPISDFHQGVEIAVAEMSAKGGFKTARMA